MEEKEYVMLTLFLPKQDYEQINKTLKYSLQNDCHLENVLGIVAANDVSVTYKLNNNHSIEIACFFKGKTIFQYYLFVKNLSDINDVINIGGKKHQLQISCM